MPENFVGPMGHMRDCGNMMTFTNNWHKTMEEVGQGQKVTDQLSVMCVCVFVYVCVHVPRLEAAFCSSV